MKWKIEINIEGSQPPAVLIQSAKTAAENAAVEVVCTHVRFVNSTVSQTKDNWFKVDSAITLINRVQDYFLVDLSPLLEKQIEMERQLRTEDKI
jgi:hypothetical protein